MECDDVESSGESIDLVSGGSVEDLMVFDQPHSPIPCGNWKMLVMRLVPSMLMMRYEDYLIFLNRSVHGTSFRRRICSLHR